MKIIIIGSSNTYHFVQYLKDDEKSEIDLQKCTKLESLKVHLDNLEETDKKVLVTVVENFVCDAVKDENGEDQVKKGVEKGNQLKIKKVFSQSAYSHTCYIGLWFL